MEYLLSTLDFSMAPARRLTGPAADFLRHIADHVCPSQRNNYHPHMLGHRALALFSIMLLAAKIFVLAALSFGPALPALSSAITAPNIISLTNDSRSQAQLPALAESSALDRAAQAKADDMLARGYFSHTSPDGRTPWNFIVDAGYNYLAAGENLAVNFTEAESVEQAWMNSPGHKANILNKNYEEIGIGISQGLFQGHEAVFVVQMFGLPAQQQITLMQSPTPVETQAVPLPTPVTGPQVLPAGETAPEAAALEPAAITDAQVATEGGAIKISAQTNETAVKVLAKFGRSAIMLQPLSDTQWQGIIPLDRITQQNTSVSLEAFDMQNRKAVKQLAEFSPSAAENYHVAPVQAPASRVLVFGRSVDIGQWEGKFYLLFIAVMLSCLVMAIGVKRRIQHVDMIANASFVVVLATMLWFAG